jgi:hypothetical protein
MPRTDSLLRLIFGAGAVLTTTVIGLSIHVLARTYETAAETQASAQPVIVAQANPR